MLYALLQIRISQLKHDWHSQGKTTFSVHNIVSLTQTCIVFIFNTYLVVANIKMFMHTKYIF